MLVLRSLLFNIVFFVWTALWCVGLLWALVMPHRVMVAGVTAYMRTLNWLERAIIGLHWEVRGLENLPRDGSYLVGAKHQSMWETMKLHLLFGDPAIVLKKELLRIPIWGWYAAKTRMIAVDRGKRGVALNSMIRGARARVAEGRPIIIFPQGTRVAMGVSKPYKVGISMLYEELGIPLVPMALNSGAFWGRNSFIKRPGTITVEFLPAIPPGLPREQVLARLEEVVESASNRLAVAVGAPATPRKSATA